MEVFQSHFADLCNIVSHDVLRLSNECTSLKLIGSDVHNYILTVEGVGSYKKATKLLYEIKSHLESHTNKQKYLLSVIEVFLNVDNPQLSIIAEKIQADLLLYS